MGSLIEQKPVKLIISIIFKEEEVLKRVEERLKGVYGPLEPLEKTLPFNYTNYYTKEMGSPLKRKLVSFKKLVGKEKLARVKIRTNRIEDLFRKDGKRQVNIDPGYITEAKLVLLTTKDYTHRVYIGDRIFAESTLHFTDGSFTSWPWTYPDYASGDIISYFNIVRETYLKDTRQ